MVEAVSGQRAVRVTRAIVAWHNMRADEALPAEESGHTTTPSTYSRPSRQPTFLLLSV